MTEEKATDSEKATIGAGPESGVGPRRRLRIMIIGVGITLVIIGVALAVYAATQEDESYMIALAPAFIGVIVVIAALFGKRLRESS